MLAVDGRYLRQGRVAGRTRVRLLGSEDQMMKFLLVNVCVIILLSSMVVHGQSPAGIDGLKWLSGCWEIE